MRSLEIHTERILNNLIKENQKLAADFVLEQSKIESSVQSPTSRLQRPEYRVQRPKSSVQLLRPESRNSGMPIYGTIFEKDSLVRIRKSEWKTSAAFRYLWRFLSVFNLKNGHFWEIDMKKN